MSRYYGYVLIEFIDGSTKRVSGNEHRIHDGQLIVFTTSAYGGPDRDKRYFPLTNIKTWRWEGE